MVNSMFPFQAFNFNENQGSYNSHKGYEEEEVLSKGKQDHLSRMENWDEVDSLSSDQFSFYQENMASKGVYLPKDEQPPSRRHQQEPTLDYCMLGSFQFNTVSSSNQLIQETAKLESIQKGISLAAETKKEQSLASLELLNNYANGYKKLKAEKLSNLDHHEMIGMGHERKLSTEEIMRLAGERYIQFCTRRVDDVYMLMHPFGSALSGLSLEETQDVELVHLLLAAAEKVSNQQFERANRLLTRCDWLASDTGNPVKRVVFYFAEALRQRIDRETGSFSSKRMLEKEKYDIAGLDLSSNLAFLKWFQELPFSQVMQFAGIQAVLENVALKTKVHLIDLSIRSGVHWTVLMQALADQHAFPIEHLKITAVGTTGREKIGETGKRLVSFSESLSLPFSFNVVFLSDMKDVKEELFDIESDEVVVIYASTILRSMISTPNSLETLMRVIRRLNPSVMVVTEVEANHNSPSFVNRFTETLFFYSAFFDCLEDCMERDNKCRMILEGMFFRHGIDNIVASEGKERTTRNVKIDVWRAFFSRFGMVEIELSESSLYQAKTVVQQFPCGSSCTLENNGKCLIVGWKGTPIHSLSAWKFL